MSSQNMFKFMVATLLTAIILSACAPAASTQAPPAATEAPATQAPAATEAPADAEKPSGKVTLWMWKAAHDALTDSGVLDAFSQEYPDVEVEIVEYQPADVYQKLPLALQAGTGAPDISLVENSHLAQIVALGGLTDMTGWVTPYLDKMNAYKWQDAKLDDKYYAMPWDSGPVVFYYRRDVFDAQRDVMDSGAALLAVLRDHRIRGGRLEQFQCGGPGWDEMRAHTLRCDFLRRLDVQALLARLKDVRFNGCLRIYTDERTALIFYRSGTPLGFFHDGSAEIETTADTSRSVARLPGARLDVLTTRAADDQPPADLLESADIAGLWLPSQPYVRNTDNSAAPGVMIST